MRTSTLMAAGLVVSGVFAPAAIGQTSFTQRLDSTSQQTSHLCRGACACPPHDVTGGIGGRLVLDRTTPDPLFEHYRVVAVDWTADVGGLPVRFTGSGTYRIGGEVARVHELSLSLSVNGSAPHLFQSGLVGATGREFPHIDIHIQSDTIVCTEYEIEVRTSPTCRADWDVSRRVDPADLAAFVNTWYESLGSGALDGDFDADGQVSPSDVASFVGAWFADAGQTCG